MIKIGLNEYKISQKMSKYAFKVVKKWSKSGQELIPKLSEYL